MDLDAFAEKCKSNKLERLKQEVLQFLKIRGSNGVSRDSFWAKFQQSTRLQIRKSDYSVKRLNDVIEIHLKDKVEIFAPNPRKPLDFYYRIKDTTCQSAANFDESDFPSLSNVPKMPLPRFRTPSPALRSNSPAATRPVIMPGSAALRSESPGFTFGFEAETGAVSKQVVDLTDTDDADSECVEVSDSENTDDAGDDTTLDVQSFDHDRLRKEIVKFLKPMTNGIKLSKLTTFLKAALRRSGCENHKKLQAPKAYKFLTKYFPTVVKFSRTRGNQPGKYLAHYITSEDNGGKIDTHVDVVEKNKTEQATPNAMSLMSALSAWGKPATAVPPVPLMSLNLNQNANKNPVPSQNFISLVDDDETDKRLNAAKSVVEQVIEIRDDSESPVSQRDSPKPGPSNVPKQIPVQAVVPTTWYNPYSNIRPNLVQVQLAGQPSLVSQLNLLQFSTPGPVIVPGNQAVNSLAQPSGSQARNNPFVGSRPEPALPGFRDSVIDLTIKPVEKETFEVKPVAMRPVFVPRGQTPSRDLVNNSAKECIDTIADANEFVSQDRIEKLLCQRFQCYHIRQLGFGYIDQIPCVNELNRLICKVNTYILGFVKTRSICTLYELKECLREYVPNKEDFVNLKLGPLQRLPIVYEQFRFPPDLAHIPEITSMDVLDMFHNFLTENGLWTKKLELEPFMDYLVKKYSADNAYMLGVRIRSLPLAAGVS